MKLTWQTKKIKIAELKEYEGNPRKLSKKDFDRLVKSLKDNGYHQRLIVDTNNVIIGGHSRKKALLSAGLMPMDEIEVLVPDRKLTDEEYLRINIQDNLSFGDFDMDLLANNYDIEQLLDWGMPADLFPDIEAIPEVTEEDDQVETDVEPRVKHGDVWILGDHRLMCGDSTNADNVSKLMAGHKPNLMVTDPPYGVEYDASWREGCDLGVGKRSKGKVLNDDRADWIETYALFPGNVAYVWHSSLHTSTIAQNLIDCGYKLISNIIWAKQHFAMSRGDYHWQHEPCWYAVKNGEKHNWQGARDQSTIWEIKNNNSFGNGDKEETVGHSTQKPIECMLRPIINNSTEEEYIYDPFGGSGTTLIACEKSNRRCLMMELSPKYCDIIINRWEKQTGKEAVLENGD